MRCPFCPGETKVIDSRPSTDDSLRRRRECLKCGKRFTTFERIERNLVVRKKDGRREAFNREKLKNGLMRACEKRPVSTEAIEKVVSDVENHLVGKGKETDSKKLGELVMRRLKKLDKVAYIRFASVYREFTDIESFENELLKLK